MAYLIVFWLGYDGPVLILAVDCDGSSLGHHSLNASHNCFVRQDFWTGLQSCFVRASTLVKIQFLTLR